MVLNYGVAYSSPAQRMRHLTRLLIAIAVLAPVAARAGQTYAAPLTPIIPASMYPSGVTVVYDADVSNGKMDAMWGRDGVGQYFMHVATQDQLRRQSGWMEAGYQTHGDSYVFFALFESTYGTLADGRHGNATALVDWRASVAGLWGLSLARSQPKGILPDGVTGQAETRVLRASLGGPTVTIAAWWGDTREVEALAIFTPDLLKLTQAKRMLAQQVRFAVRVP